MGRPARILLLGPNWQNGADEQQRVGQTTTHKAGGIGNLRANGVGALLSSFMVCGHRAAMQHLMTAVHAVFEASASMHRMGPAPGQQEARAGEVSGREKQGVAYGRPHAGAHKQRGTRGRAVAARARAKSGPETAISEQNLTSIKIQEGTPLDELNSGTPAARNRSGPSSAAARCHGRPGPGPGGAAAQPNAGTCENAANFAMLL